ncbi:MAG TPA: cytochrome c [Candidatus Didemnitutus sp.]|nr:cytochrome c [Candidatus Didemnitutus sp.]
MKTSVLRLAVLTFSALFISTYASATPAAENWENSCASCHGADGKGQTKQGKKLKVKDYTDSSALAKFTDEELAKATANGVTVDGKERMKAFKDELSAEDIAGLVKYIREFAKK